MKYRVQYLMGKWYQVEVEAGSEDEALAKFNDGDHSMPEGIGYGDMVEDSIEIVEVEE